MALILYDRANSPQLRLLAQQIGSAGGEINSPCDDYYFLNLTKVLFRSPFGSPRRPSHTVRFLRALGVPLRLVEMTRLNGRPPPLSRNAKALYFAPTTPLPMTGLYLSVKPISFRRFGASFGRGNSNYHTNLSAKNFADKYNLFFLRRCRITTRCKRSRASAQQAPICESFRLSG